MCKPWGTWKSPELISVSPLAIVSGQETSMSLKGRNLSASGTKLVLISPFSGCCGVLFFLVVFVVCFLLVCFLTICP